MTRVVEKRRLLVSLVGLALLVEKDDLCAASELRATAHAAIPYPLLFTMVFFM